MTIYVSCKIKGVVLREIINVVECPRDTVRARASQTPVVTRYDAGVGVRVVICCLAGSIGFWCV